MSQTDRTFFPAARRPDQNPFRSFWMGGFECADHMNTHGDRVDLLTITGHLPVLADDYRRVLGFDIATVREGIRWSHVEKQPYRYDWTDVQTMIRAGQAAGVQQLWDICHFGYPDDLSPLHPHFTRRFVALCRAFVRMYRDLDPDGTLVVTPINEVGFISWLGGEVGGAAPYAVRIGWEVKYALMRAYIEAVYAMREADPGIRFLTTEPIVNMVPPTNATLEEIEAAAAENEEQFQVLDLLSGRICPELGGRHELLDILGFNYYYNNQWVLGMREFLRWANDPPDPRWRPLSSLLLEAYGRYERPIIIAETSHPREDRPHWMHFIAEQCAELLRQHVPLWGVCLYPIIDRPDWNDLTYWHHAGLWDARPDADGFPERVLYQPYADALIQAQLVVQGALATNGKMAGRVEG